MARRRVNTRFLWIITIVICLGVLGVVALKLIRHHGPAYYAALGDKQLAAGNLQEAAQDYGQAFYASHSQSPEYLIKAGDVLWKQTADDPELLAQAIGTWQKVLEVDPHNVPALSRLLNTLIEEVQIGARADVLTMLSEDAKRLNEADPSNAQAAAWVKIAPVQAYVAGVATDPVKLEKQLVDLQKVYTDDPSNAQAMMVMAQARLHLAQEASQRNDPDEAEKQRQLSVSTFDEALKKQPNNPDVLLHAAEIQAAIMRMMDLRVMAAQQSGQSSPEIDKAAALANTLRQQCTANCKHGQSLLNPSNDNYEDLALIAIGLQMQLNDGPGAVKSCQDLLKNMPDSLRGRVIYAKILKQSPQHWQEAIAMLSAPTSGKASQLGPKARLLKGEQMQVLIELTALRIDLCADEKDPTKKADLLNQIQDGYTKLAAGIGHETPETLTLKGRILQLQGKTIDAIQALEKAEASYQAAGRSDNDVELSRALAWAYWRVGQTGQARRLLKQIVDDYPTYTPARVMLVELLLDENDAKDAEPHIQFLEKTQSANNPDVVQMRFAAYIVQGQMDQAKALYARFPENNPTEQLIKARDADKIGDFADEQRLLEKIHKAYPDDIMTLAQLAQFYAQHDQRDKAVKLIDQAIATHPNAAPQLQLARQQLLTNSPEQQQALLQQSIENSNRDPVIKELQLFAIAQQQGKTDEAMKHLDKAEQLGPDNPHVLETRLNLLLSRKDWDGAQKYVDRLTKLNFDNADGLFYQHQMAMAKEDYDQAIDLASRAIAKLPQFGQGYIAMGQALQAEGRYQEAINKYLDALDKQNNNIDAIKGVIGCYYAMNRPQDAARYIAAGRQADPNNLLMREIEVEYSLKYGDGTLAITARQDVLKSDPDNSGNVQNLGMAYQRAASYRLDQHDTSGAQPYVDKLRALINDGLRRWPQERGFYGLAADLSVAIKDFDYGQNFMNQMVAQAQWANDPQTYYILANFYRQFNKLDQAESALRTSLDKGGGVNYRIELATFLSQRNQPDEALKLLEPMVDTDQVREERAQILLAANRAMEAEPIVRDLLNRNPNSPVYQQQMLQIEGNEGKIDALVADTTAMLAKNPKDSTALYYRGMAKMRQAVPDLDGAMHDFQAVIDNDPTNVEARYLLADIYRQRNDWDSAISQVQQALTAQPNNKAVRVKLIQLEGSAVPPRWSDVEKLIGDAQADPVMQNDPAWSVEAGNMWRTRGDSGQALSSFQNAMKLAPKDQSIFRAYIETLLWANQPGQVLSLTESPAGQPGAPAWIHEDRAIAATRVNQPALAKAEILAALDSPNVVRSSQAIINLVQASTASKQVDAVVAALGEKTASDGRWQMLAGYLLHEQRNDAQAAEMMSRAAANTSLSPAEQTEAARWAGSLYMSMQPPDFEKAITMTKLVLNTDPNSVEALNNLACMLVDSVKPPRPAEALQYSQRAYDLMRKSNQIQPLIQDTQGWVLLNNGRVDDALLLLRQVVDNKPFLDAYYHLAEAYLRHNQPLAAQQQLTLATQLLEDMKKNSQQYDQTLPGRIDQAKEEAKNMMKMQASAPR